MLAHLKHAYVPMRSQAPEVFSNNSSGRMLYLTSATVITQVFDIGLVLTHVTET
jgi:hypothetical protein